jgi:hypothetical protein
MVPPGPDRYSFDSTARDRALDSHDETNMTTHTEVAHQKIVDAAAAAKDNAVKLIDNVADAAHTVVDKARETAHDAGEKVKDTGAKIIKGAE